MEIKLFSLASKKDPLQVDQKIASLGRINDAADLSALLRLGNYSCPLLSKSSLPLKISVVSKLFIKLSLYF